MSTLSYHTRETQDSPKYSMICLHGLGANGDDLAALAPLLALDHLPFRFICPNAPIKPVTLNGGFPMPAWYDIHGLDSTFIEDEPGIIAAEQQIYDLIKQQNDLGIPSHHIFLLGFSQGGALALFTGLRHAEPLAGIIGISTYLPARETLLNSLHEANQNTPILLAHGENDVLVEPKLALQAKQLLTQRNYTIDWHTYPIEHNISPEEITDISRWLQVITKKITVE